MMDIAADMIDMTIIIETEAIMETGGTMETGGIMKEDKLCVFQHGENALYSGQDYCLGNCGDPLPFNQK